MDCPENRTNNKSLMCSDRLSCSQNALLMPNLDTVAYPNDAISYTPLPAFIIFTSKNLKPMQAQNHVLPKSEADVY